MKTMVRHLLLSLPLIALPLTTNAFNLGQLNPRSREGESLDATIELYLAPHERAMPMRVTLAPDLFSPQRSSAETLLRAIASEVKHYPDGYSMITLRSAIPLNFTGLSFRLRVQQGAQTLSRAYTIELPPLPAPLLDRSHLRNATPRTAITEPSDLPRNAAVTSMAYGPVRSGDTLWAIAKNVRGSSSHTATLQALHAANPDAFVNGDINRLKVGVTLALPTSGERATPASVALPDQPTAAVTDLSDDFFASTPKTSPSVTVATPSAAPVLARDPTLARQLAEMDAKFAAIRAQYAENSTITPPLVTTEMSASTATFNPLQPAPAALTAPDPADPLRVIPVSASDMDSPKPSHRGALVLIGLLLAAILTAVVSYARRRHLWRLQLQTAFEAREANTEAEVAARVDDVTDVIERQDAPAEASATNLTTSLDGLELAPKVVALLAPVGDTQDDIDANIAHGRYQDAEHLLQQLIEAAPRNVAAKLRLAEVYYLTEQVEAFSELAEDLQLHHREHLTNDEWRRLVRMGEIIIPHLSIFAGPRAVNSG